MDERTADAKDRKLWPTAVKKHFIEVLLEKDAKGNMPQGQFKTGTWTTLIGRTRMRWDLISNTVTASEEAWAAAFAEFKKNGLKHYDLLGKLFNSNTTTGFLQISSAQPAPNSDEERELDATFLSEEVHVNVNTDGVDDVEELPTLSEAQSRRQAKKRLAEPSHLSEKRKKRHSLESMTEAIWGFINMRNRRGKRSTNIEESSVGGNNELVTQAITLLNQHIDVDHVTYCKVVQEFHISKSRATFFAMMVDKRRAWIEFIGGGLL
ncbi:uncharacterized protein At2g29880 [Quercus suber]|nr:uncharacterized protein At2g29880-like [Quercus suber]